MQLDRTSGLLLHVTTLPGPWGVGDLGPEAFRFVDFLCRCGCSIWQILPTGPVGAGWSPYASSSSFAWSELFVSPDRMLEEGWIDRLPDCPRTAASARVDYSVATALKSSLIDAAWEQFDSSFEFDTFRMREAHWLDDHALYSALKQEYWGMPWVQWPESYRDRHPDALRVFRDIHRRGIGRVAFGQFLVERQWRALRLYCRDRSVRIFGDCPLYVAHDSVDVWANRDLFDLDDAGQPLHVAGVPPDYFSDTGQRWGNPLYRWDRMQRNGFAWWTRRLKRVLDQVDVLRLDHFRGFSAYWAIPASEETAVNGEWLPGPGAELFRTLTEALGVGHPDGLPIIAEDLGTIDDGVRRLMAEFDFPGMAILEFAFDSGQSNPYLPPNYGKQLVAYTGTHDNETFMGWWQAGAGEASRAFLESVAPGESPHRQAIRALLESEAGWVIVPVQDLLGLGAEARMNTPGQAEGNWVWRLDAGIDLDHSGRWLADWIERTDRKS